MTGDLLSIDPGKHASGWALFSSGVLLWAGFDPPFRPSEQVGRVVVEIPQVRRLGTSKGDPNDLIEIAIVAGRWLEASNAREEVRYYPSEWKGQLPKDVTELRARAVLTEQELAAVPRIARTRGGTDMWDAIAIGLVNLKRLRMRSRA